jgi:DNA-binding beta-propeller fold protein YncE
VDVLSIFSARTFHKIEELQLKGIGRAPAFSGDGKYIFSGSGLHPVDDDYDQVLVVDAKTLQVVGHPINIQWKISHITASSGNYIFVVSSKWRLRPADPPFPPQLEPTNDPAMVSVIDCKTLQVVGQPISLGVEPTDIAISPDGARVYVSNRLSKTISVIDAKNLQLIGQPLPVQGIPECLSVSLDGHYLFVAMYDTFTGRLARKIQTFETKTFHIVNQIGPIDGLYDYDTINKIATSLDNASVIALSFKEAWVVIPSSVTGGVSFFG